MPEVSEGLPFFWLAEHFIRALSWLPKYFETAQQQLRRQASCFGKTWMKREVSKNEIKFNYLKKAALLFCSRKKLQY